VALQVLQAKGQSNVEIARTSGAMEGAVHHRLRRAADGAVANPPTKPRKTEDAFPDMGLLTRGTNLVKNVLVGRLAQSG
jgi:hypothetical protein